MNKLERIKVPVQVVLGDTELTVKEIAELAEGTIIGLRSFAGQPVDLIAAGEPIAKGEVVVIDENFGLRITRLADTGEA